jgi:hypothetical protein
VSTIVGPTPGQRIGGVRGIPPAQNGKYLKSTVSAPIWNDIQASEIVGLASATAITARVYRSTVQSFPNAVYTTAVFDTERYDNGDLWSPASPDRFVIIRDGTYVITGVLTWNLVAGGSYRLVGIQKNGNFLVEDGPSNGTFVAGIAPRSAATAIIKCVPGDVIQLLAYQDSGAAITNYNWGGAAYQWDALEFSIALIAGAKGDKGDTGPPGTGGGGGGGVNFEYTQGSPSATWSITHNLGVHPSVTVVDTGGTVVEPDVHYDSLNAITVSFGSATSGKAFLN